MRRARLGVAALAAGVSFTAPADATIIWINLASGPSEAIIDDCYGGEAPAPEEEVNECACNALGFDWGSNGCFS